uniref:Rpn family recombination-promoting nuclease/putative transposase n=1 Tax=Okeania sp. SIO2F4 TaxID=2607790 RepID=UPI0025F57F72|nr:Rpn family recombination-promoting nuclease/putative transposase [Okeania sp. SIO2F4]
MRFISPKIDYAFKKIFGYNKSQDILISFLNAIIYEGKNKIKSLEIIDPYSPGQVEIFKDSFFDFRAVLDDKSTVIIEMQVANVAGFENRVVYNAAKIYSNQLKSREDYPEIRPIIALTIVDFLMFPNTDRLITDFVLKDRLENFEYTKEQIGFVFVELPKFKKNLSELETLTDKWIDFIKEAAILEEIPTSLKEVPEIEKALNIANRANLTPQELEKLHGQETLLRDRRGQIAFAREEGEEKGRIKQAIALIIRLLKKRFGEVPENLKNQLSDLSLSEL